MVLIENRSNTGYVLFFNAINNAYLLYKHNCKLFDMPPKELLDFCADLVNLLICQGIESDQWSLKVRVIPEMAFQVVVLSFVLEKLAYQEESVATASSSSRHLCLLFL